MTDPKPRRWFQLHLSTAIVLMISAGVCMGFGIHVHQELGLLKCDDPSAKIARLHVDAENTPESLTEAVRLNFIRGDMIAIVEVVKQMRFLRGKGQNAGSAEVSKILLNFKDWHIVPERSIPIHPDTDLDRVIMLQHADGDWIPWSPVTEEKVKRTLQRLAAIEEKLNNDSLEKYLYNNPVGASLLALAGLAALVVACEYLARHREVSKP